MISIEGNLKLRKIDQRYDSLATQYIGTKDTIGIFNNIKM